MLLLVRAELGLKQPDDAGGDSITDKGAPAEDVRGRVTAAYMVSNTQQIIAIVDVPAYSDVVPLCLSIFPMARHLDLKEVVRLQPYTVPTYSPRNRHRPDI